MILQPPFFFFFSFFKRRKESQLEVIKAVPVPVPVAEVRVSVWDQDSGVSEIGCSLSNYGFVAECSLCGVFS